MGAGFWALYVAFAGLDADDLLEQLRGGHYVWAFPVLLVTVVTHVLRALRWELLLHRIGQPTHLGRTFSAILVSYLASYAVPRVGEGLRCVLVGGRDSARLAGLFGTVVVERATDVLCLFVVGLLAASRVSDTLWATLRAGGWAKVEPLLGFWWPMAVVGLAGLLYFLRRYWRVYGLRFREGLLAFWQLERPWLFVGYSILIWMGYFGMTYLWFFAFTESQDLGVLEGLLLVFVGGVARSLPIQGGGMGAYHWLFSRTAAELGAPLLVGQSLAVVIHGFQSVFYLIGGGLAWFYLYLCFYQKKF
ncbi:MAG: lysylphosphatidylglycerol synthase transmembrane domain-containing protein [Bernardetiaceae bacterium]